jgi:hypothetical protein
VEIECQILEQNIPLTVGVPDDDWDLDVVDLDEDSSEEEEDESYDEE